VHKGFAESVEDLWPKAEPKIRARVENKAHDSGVNSKRQHQGGAEAFQLLLPMPVRPQQSPRAIAWLPYC
jgi:hypothetical protein